MIFRIVSYRIEEEEDEEEEKEEEEEEEEEEEDIETTSLKQAGGGRRHRCFLNSYIQFKLRSNLECIRDFQQLQQFVHHFPLASLFFISQLKILPK